MKEKQLWTREKLIKEYIEFFKSKNHKEIPNAPLMPENDPTVLFTTAGMHPLVPFLLGQKHPIGKRLVNVQRCIRTTDIDVVGDVHHLTFFEMLGNWSMGDYWKKEAIEWSLEFLIKVLGFKKEQIHVTCFEGNKYLGIPRDDEVADIWKSLGIPESRIYFNGMEDNWWGPAGTSGPCGPDTEMFIDTGRKKCSKDCQPKCNCGKYFEIWNDVFMQYNKTARTILVDGMHTLYNKNFEINQELLNYLNSLSNKKILVVNGYAERARKLLPGWGVFSLEEEKIDKEKPEFFKKLINKFDFKPEELIYFDHLKDNVESARSLGINSNLYKDNAKFFTFINNNLYAFIPLKQKNVDTGMGVERTVAMLNGKDNIYENSDIEQIVDEVRKNLKKSLSKESLGKDKSKREGGEDEKREENAVRIIADHVRASVFILLEKIIPSNTEQGYILRRLIRRAIRYGKEIGIENNFLKAIAGKVIEIYRQSYKEFSTQAEFILREIDKEETKFRSGLEKGMNLFRRKVEELRGEGRKKLSGEDAFLLYQSYGFPIEMTVELGKEEGIEVDVTDYNKEYEKHKELSRTATAGRFRGGLADHSDETTRLHTASHLLLAALNKVLGRRIEQRGSHITAERARFDFTFDRKLTDEEVRRVEEFVNDAIKTGKEVARKEMSLEEAKKEGAHGAFEHKYGERVSVYVINGISKELCGGPHVKSLKELQGFKFKITEQESIGAGARRVKGILEPKK